MLSLSQGAETSVDDFCALASTNMKMGKHCVRYFYEGKCLESGRHLKEYGIGNNGVIIALVVLS